MASANRRADLVLGTSLGGVGRHVKALAEALQQESAAVAVHGPAVTESTVAFTRSGAAFEAVDIPVGLAPVRALRSGRALREQLLAADLVHAHGLRAGVLAARARRKLRSRKPWSFVATWHNVPQSAR